MKEIKFRAWNNYGKYMLGSAYGDWVSFDGVAYTEADPSGGKYIAIKKAKDYILMQFTGLKDKNGKDIYEGDILEFADKWEWYRTSYGIKMHFAEPEARKKLEEKYNQEPMERRVVKMPECYEWILSSEIQTYWHVIGNIYETPEKLTL